MYYSRHRFAALGVIAALSVTACAVPHNNVLIFGTDTSFGVGVEIAPDPTSPVGVTIGYKRKEAVWMPLIVNRQECKVVKDDDDNPTGKVCTTVAVTDGTSGSPPKVVASAKYTGKASGVDKDRGGSTYEEDTYSVFASFGGKAKGGKDGASLGMAQFFATGIAAQRLGANPSAAQMVSTQDPGTEALKQANKRAENAEDAKKKTEALLEVTKMSPEELVKNMEIGQRLAGLNEARIHFILKEVVGTDTGFGSSEKAKLMKLTDDALEAQLAKTKDTSDEAKKSLEDKRLTTLKADKEKRIDVVTTREELENALKGSSSFTVKALFLQIYDKVKKS